MIRGRRAVEAKPPSEAAEPVPGATATGRYFQGEERECFFIL